MTTEHARRLVGIVAATGLPGAEARPSSEVLDADVMAELLDLATAERIPGHLVAALDSGVIRATPEQRAEAGRRHEEALALDLVLERLLAETSSTFSDAGIAHRALKGPVVARTLYAETALRSFGDVDVLVAADQFDEAVALLVARGGRPRYQEPRTRFTSRFGKGVCVVTGDGLELDVHRVFVAGPFGLAIDAQDLFADPCSILVGGVQIPVPGPDLTFLHVCYHAALGDRAPRYTTLRDIAEFLCTPSVDVDHVLSLAKRWRGRAVLQRALLLTGSYLRFEVPQPLRAWTDSYRPDAFERAALAVYVSPDATYAARAATGVWALHGTRRKLAYARALLMPTRSYLRERDGSYVQRWQRALQLQRRWRQAR
jgi:hypothetical protein